MRKEINILFIKNQAEEISLAVNYLRKAGFDVLYDVITEPEELKERLLEGNHDLVISDPKLARISASMALTIMRTLGFDIPMIIMANGDNENLVAALKAGAFDYIEKDRLYRLPKMVKDVLRIRALERQRRRLNQLLREVETRFNTIVESSQDAILVIQNERIVYSNLRTSIMTGYTNEELLGKPFAFLLHPDEDPSLPDSDTSHLKEYKLRTKTGESMWVEMGFSSVKWQERPALLAMVRDITERKRAEEELKTLYRLGLDISSSVNLEELLDKVSTYIYPLFGTNTFYIAVYNEKRNTLVFEIDYEDGVKQQKLEVSLREADGLTGWIFKNKTPVLIGDWDQEWRRYPIVPLFLNKKTKSYLGVPIIYQDKVIGVIAVQSDRVRTFDEKSLKLLTTMAAQLSVAIKNVKLIEDLKMALREVEKSYEITLEALVSALDFREHETQFHSKRVASYAVRLARELGVKDEELKYIYWGGLLHDIGKIGVSDSILLKPGSLTDEEWEEMKRHPEIGYRIIENIDFLGPAKDIVLYHHERWDGKGYPLGLSGENIPFYARIFSVIDALDAITTDRPYRKAQSFTKALQEIRRCSGTQFDPEVVKAFLRIPISEWKKIKQEVLEVRGELSKQLYVTVQLAAEETRQLLGSR
ncbi:MAG: HD domain-containing protein [Candidatus Hydrothermae bacterium]|nr:HD domain-containing protein [Candidatus Hydrothermae bacterium]